MKRALTNVALYLSLLIYICLASAGALAQSGGTFQIEKSVIAGGGGRSSGGTFSIENTTGQSIAGTVSTGGAFSIESGFWTSTASFFAVSGRVRNAQGRGITNAVVTLDDNGSIRTVRTGRLGFYRFDGVQGGRTYLLSVTSRRFSFPNNPRMIVVNDNVGNEDFTANP